MTAVKITEVAKELGVKKCEAILLADVGVLNYVCDGKNGHVKTVTLDSFWKAKKMDQDEMASIIKKESSKRKGEKKGLEGGKEASVQKTSESKVEDKKTCGVLILEVLRAILDEVKEIRKEIRQVRGLSAKGLVQAELPIEK